MSSLDHFSNGFIQAVARSKQKAKEPAQHAVQSKPVQQAQMVSANVLSTTKATTTKLSDEQYKTWITAKAIAHIHKQKGEM